jgi:NAD(P)-dependent dehydrogenase (short-subunit alcohol dehydrogenase family)
MGMKEVQGTPAFSVAVAAVVSDAQRGHDAESEYLTATDNTERSPGNGLQRRNRRGHRWITDTHLRRGTRPRPDLRSRAGCGGAHIGVCDQDADGLAAVVNNACLNRDGLLVKKTGGVIVFIASLSRQGNVGQTNHSAAKAGVVAMTGTRTIELSRYDIRAVVVSPGLTATEMALSMPDEARARDRVHPSATHGEARRVRSRGAVRARERLHQREDRRHRRRAASLTPPTVAHADTALALS